MLRDVEASCPGCQAKVKFDVEVPDPQVSVKVIEDTSRVNALTQERDDFRAELEATAHELHRWQNGQRHLQASDILDLLLTCPTCRATLDAFAGRIRQEAISGLTADQVKQIAKSQQWWPPPPIELPDNLFSGGTRR